LSAALIPLTAVEAAARPPLNRPRADFVAQVIATKMEAPQTRARRRAEPDAAAAAYGTHSRAAPPSGSALSRSV